MVAGEEWKDGCVSAGVVAVMGDKFVAMDVGMECVFCWKKGPGFSVPDILLPLYCCCCGERLEDHGSLFDHVYPALPVCESGEDPPFIAMGDVCRWAPAFSATDRPVSRVSPQLCCRAALLGRGVQQK